MTDRLREAVEAYEFAAAQPRGAVREEAAAIMDQKIKALDADEMAEFTEYVGGSFRA